MAGPNGPNLNPVAGQVLTHNGSTLAPSWETPAYTGTGPFSGPTSGRPAPVALGQPYFDTTLGYPVWCSQISPPIWVNAAGAAK